MIDEIANLDATAQAELVKKGEVQPIELVEAAISCIEHLNPKINAVITPLYEKARSDALSGQLPDGPFKGVPLLLKDYMCQTAGDPYYEGMGFLRNLNWQSSHDTYLAQKFRQAGFIFLGKTNLPELAGSATTEPIAFGPTRNPFNLEHSVGGSSGGSAAAVASGMVAIAHGNDGTGSLRVPAACCGLVGLKPSRGRISTGPASSGGILGNAVEFVLTKSVRDAAGVLDCIAGAMLGDLFLASPPKRPFIEELDGDLQQLRIGLLVNDIFLQNTVHEDCIQAVETAAKVLEGLGHHIEYAHPPAYYFGE